MFVPRRKGAAFGIGDPEASGGRPPCPPPRATILTTPLLPGLEIPLAAIFRD